MQNDDQPLNIREWRRRRRHFVGRELQEFLEPFVFIGCGVLRSLTSRSNGNPSAADVNRIECQKVVGNEREEIVLRFLAVEDLRVVVVVLRIEG
jgi:hypothetical protein